MAVAQGHSAVFCIKRTYAGVADFIVHGDFSLGLSTATNATAPASHHFDKVMFYFAGDNVIDNLFRVVYTVRYPLFLPQKSKADTASKVRVPTISQKMEKVVKVEASLLNTLSDVPPI